eukprot:2438134-Prymnesium_polylepis.2
MPCVAERRSGTANAGGHDAQRGRPECGERRPPALPGAGRTAVARCAAKTKSTSSRISMCNVRPVPSPLAHKRSRDMRR